MILALLLACTTAPRVLVVVTDTTRADLGGADWPVWATPAAGARVYSAAWAASSWTGPSTAALVTGAPRAWDATLRPIMMPPAPRLDCWSEAVVSDNVWAAHAARAVCGADAGRTVGDLHASPSERAALVRAEADATGADALLVQVLGPHEPIPGAYADAMADTLAEVGPMVLDAVAQGATVVWTSDHGEALGPDRHGHGLDLADDQIHVPLVVWGPGVDPGEDPTPTGAHCVAATVRRVLGEQDHGCDLRTGDVSGLPVAGMCLAHDGYRCTQWVERQYGEAAP